jgi:hypothetical protein
MAITRYLKQDENLPFNLSQVVVTTCKHSGREITFQGVADDNTAWRWLTPDEEAQFEDYRAGGGSHVAYEMDGE